MTKNDTPEPPMSDEQVTVMADLMQKISRANSWLNAAPEFNDLAHGITLAAMAWRQENENQQIDQDEMQRIIDWIFRWYTDCAIINMLICGKIGVKYPADADEPSFSHPVDESPETPVANEEPTANDD